MATTRVKVEKPVAKAPAKKTVSNKITTAKKPAANSTSKKQPAKATIKNSWRKLALLKALQLKQLV